MNRRNFKEWLEKFRSSIASYEYYTNFEKIFKNVNDIKIELNILNSLIGSQNIKEDFENINKTVQDILNKKFPKIPYNQNICGLCEFRNYCWGIQ